MFAVVRMLATCAALSIAPASFSQEKFPSKPVRVVVPFAAGGVGDTVARTISNQLAEQLGQPVVVDNRPGGDGLTATEHAAKSQADGYTILQVSTTQIINQVLREKPKFDLLRDFVPVARVVRSTLVLVVPASSPYTSVRELVAAANAKPGGLTYGSGAIGSVGHLSAELLKRAGGIQTTHVPYKGNAALMPDLMGGRLDFSFTNQPEAVHGLQSGRLRLLAVTAPQRNPALPNVPTMIESGFPGFDPSSMYGYMVPAGTPAPIVAQLHAAMVKAVASPSVQERFKTLGMTSEAASPEEFATSIKKELGRWAQVVKAANIQAE